MSTRILTFGNFEKKIAGTADEVWTILLKLFHGMERHTEEEWRALIAHYGKQPAHQEPVKPSVPPAAKPVAKTEKV